MTRATTFFQVHRLLARPRTARRAAAPAIAALAAGAMIVLAAPPAMSASAGLAPAAPAAMAVGASSTQSDLASVYCTSSSNCWAVGSFELAGAVRDQTEHWQGTKWVQVGAPSPGGTASGDESQLNAVRCTSPKNCWAVGTFTLHQATLPDILHWNSRKWTKVRIPNPGAGSESGVNSLLDVACTSAKNCWATGQYHVPSSAGEESNLALHWDGKQWSLAATPNPGGTRPHDSNTLSGIRCTSPANCWAVGSYQAVGKADFNEVLRWNGHAWSQVTVPSPGGDQPKSESFLLGLSCVAAGDCWAVGSYQSAKATEGTLNEALHWNGQKWLKQEPLNVSGTGFTVEHFLSGISCISGGTCIAVGFVNVGPGAVNQAVRWNGHKWMDTDVPNPSGDSFGSFDALSAVRCVSSTDCWVVGGGGSDGVEQDQFQNWNGTTWSG